MVERLGTTGKGDPGMEFTLRMSSDMGVDFVRGAMVYRDTSEDTASFSRSLSWDLGLGVCITSGGFPESSSLLEYMFSCEIRWLVTLLNKRRDDKKP